ncbi:MAG TPA: hypothetical protein VK211_12230 [Kamptonema sp.]|nr:hypothetical protein [Kamptonema sp.]
MAKPCNQPLKTNPFTADRDPHTGKWTVSKRVQQTYKSDSNLNLVHQSGLIDSIEVKRPPQTEVLVEHEDAVRCG